LRLARRSAVVTALLITGCDGCHHDHPLKTIPDAGPLVAIPLPATSVAALVNPQGLPAYADDTGSVEGTIFVTGAPPAATPADFSKCPGAEAEYGHAFREGAPKTPGGPRPLADAIVAITGYRGFFVPETAEVKPVTIVDCGFSARTVTMTFGQRLEVKNLTREYFTPLIEPAPNFVVMMAPPFADPVKIYPKKPGRYRLLDRDRKYVVADLFAFLHPLHGVSDLSGSYRIDGIPVGKVTVNTSHPQIAGSEASRDVEIKAGATAHVDLTLESPVAAPVPVPALVPDAGVDGSRP
jgi:hypothetical protein